MNQGRATLLIATTNPGKLREILPLLDELPITFATLADWPQVEAPEETGRTFAENARLKAQYYAAATGLVTVAEDSGLEVDALAGAPGVESARFGGADSSYPEKFRLLYDLIAAKRQAIENAGKPLDAAGKATRTARFVCALALASAEPAAILFEARGTIEGEIAPEPRGNGGFGYDPIFYYPPFGCTLAEAGERKSTVSHRAAAFRALRVYLEGGPL